MSGIKICIDTNIFLNVLNRESGFFHASKEVLEAVDGKTLKAVIPTLVVAEILTGFYLDNKNERVEDFLSSILSNKNIEVVQLSVDIAVSSASIRAKTGMRLPDSIVLSTALHEKVDYLVSNDDSFPKEYEKIHTIKSTVMANLL